MHRFSYQHTPSSPPHDRLVKDDPQYGYTQELYRSLKRAGDSFSETGGQTFVRIPSPKKTEYVVGKGGVGIEYDNREYTSPHYAAIVSGTLSDYLFFCV